MHWRPLPSLPWPWGGVSVALGGWGALLRPGWQLEAGTWAPTPGGHRPQDAVLVADERVVYCGGGC